MAHSTPLCLVSFSGLVFFFSSMNNQCEITFPMRHFLCIFQKLSHLKWAAIPVLVVTRIFYLPSRKYSVTSIGKLCNKNESNLNVVRWMHPTQLEALGQQTSQKTVCKWPVGGGRDEVIPEPTFYSSIWMFLRHFPSFQVRHHGYKCFSLPQWFVD